MGEKGEGSGGYGGGKWGIWGRELGMWYPPVYPLKMDLEGHYPQNTISYCIILNETQITLHIFQGQISAMPEISADLFLAIS